MKTSITTSARMIDANIMGYPYAIQKGEILFTISIHTGIKDAYKALFHDDSGVYSDALDDEFTFGDLMGWGRDCSRKLAGPGAFDTVVWDRLSWFLDRFEER